MKKLVLSPDVEKSSFGDRYCVTADFTDSRISGTLTFGSMSTPDYFRYWGTVTVNGIEYRVSNNSPVSGVKVEHYALTKNGTFSDYASPSARETFRKALEEIVVEVLKDEKFVTEQLATECQYIGYDIDRLVEERTALLAKIAEINDEITNKLSKKLSNRQLIG